MRAVKLDGEPWLCLADLCGILGMTNVSRAAKRLDEDEMRDARVERPGGGTQQMLMVNRSGMYHLVLTSRVPEAVRLRQWVTRDVLPAIETDGFYGTDEWKAELANTTAMIRGSMSGALGVLRNTPGAGAEKVVAQLERVLRERVEGDLVGICGGAEAYRALL